MAGRAPSNTRPRPDRRTAERARHELLERESELAELDRLIDTTLQGAGGLVVIEGPAGIGKTRLLTAVQDRAYAAGMEVLTARAGELERDLAWGVVRGLLEAAIADATKAQRQKLLSGAAGLAGPVFGFEQTGPTPTAADALGSALHGLYWLAANLSARAPLLMAVDDAQWADATSLRWLAYLGRRLEGLSILVVACVRSAEPSANGKLLGALMADPQAQVVRPAPLSQEASDRLVRADLSDAEPEFCAACHAATGGNPFLLSELLTQLAADGIAPNSAEAAHIHEIKTATVARSVLLRLSRLPPPAVALAQAVAVLGAEASLRHAAAIAGIEQSVAGKMADALTAADILQPRRPLEFVHPLVRAALHAEIPPSDLVEGHASAARLLGEAGAGPQQLGLHLLAVEPAGDAWVFETLRAAAREALARGGADNAVTYLRRALEEPPPADERVPLLRELGGVEVSVGRSAGTEHLAEALRLADDPATRAQVALDLGRGLTFGGRLREACDVLVSAIDEFGGADRELELRLEAELLEAADYELTVRPLAVERVRRMGTEFAGETLGERLLLARLALEVATGMGTAAEATELAERALTNDDLLTGDTPDSQAANSAADALVLADRFDDAMRVYDRLTEDARAQGSALGVAQSTFWRSHASYRRGEVADAEAYAREALDALELAGWMFAAPTVTAFLMDAMLERGELDAAAEALERVAMPDPPPATAPMNRLLHARGRLRVARGQVAEGLEDLLEAGRRLELWQLTSPAWIPWRSTAALALERLGKSAEARRLAGEELELAQEFGAARTLGVAQRAAGLVEKGKKRVALLEQAVATLADSGAVLEHARALTDLGAALRRAGQRKEAREHLRTAAELAGDCGASALAEQASEELRAAGAKPRRDALRGRDSLTASELRVVRMAAEGATNRDIAQGLFVTLRTVETHLTHAYQKLNIQTRADLGAALESRSAAVAG